MVNDVDVAHVIIARGVGKVHCSVSEGAWAIPWILGAVYVRSTLTVHGWTRFLKRSECVCLWHVSARSKKNDVDE